MNFHEKMHTISVLVEGRKCYLKVTKDTTCDDLIQHVLNYKGLKENDKDPYFLIVSNNITEKQLSRNARILNVAKDLMSESNRIHFIMRKKTRLFQPKISIAKHRRFREKSSAKEQMVENIPSTKLDASKYTPSMKASEQIRGVKQLYQLVQVQKRRLSEVYPKRNGTAKFLKQTISKMTIHSKADTSLDQFLKNMNKENMQGIFSFCDMVATKEMKNLSPAWPISPSVYRSVMNDCPMRCMPHPFESPHVDSELSNGFETVPNDVLMLDKLYHREEGDGSTLRMALPPSQRLSITHPSRMRRNNKPLHSTPLAKKSMKYLNKSINPTRVMGSTRLPLDRLTNRKPKEMPRCDSSLNRKLDGEQFMFIWQGRSAFSSQKDKCMCFFEQSNVSDSDDSLDKRLLDKVHDDAVLNDFDDNRNVSTDSASSFNVLSRKLANDHSHLRLAFDRSPRDFPHVHDMQEEANDCFYKENLKMKLANYSLINSNISSMSCESVEMSCDWKKRPCVTFARDYVTRFEYTPERLVRH